MKQTRPTQIFVLLTLLFSGTIFPRQATANAPSAGGWSPDVALNVGPSLAWVGGKAKHSFAPGLDITLAFELNRPLFFWFSGGARLWASPVGTAVLPYGEAGLSFLFFNLGAGYSPGLAGGYAPDHGVNGFAGLTIPIWAPEAGHLMYMEPYYRPTVDVAGESHPWSHELGVMFKWLFTILPKEFDLK